MRTISLLLILLFSIASCTQPSEATFNKEFAHVVYFWFHNPDSAEDKAAFETSLNKFLNASQYAKTNFVGTAPKATRDVVDDSFTYNLIVTFESASAQEAYQKEEAHLTFIEESKHLWKKVIVYDAVPAE